jgi:hypothetical protein
MERRGVAQAVDAQLAFTLAAVLICVFAFVSPAASVPSIATFVAILGRSLGRIDGRRVTLASAAKQSLIPSVRSMVRVPDSRRPLVRCHHP